jgi:hypothetical protein
MAQVVLGIGTSHAPFLNGTVERWAEGGKRDMADARGGGMPMNLDIPAMIKERESWIGKELTAEVWQRRHEACQRAIATLGDVLADAAPDVAVVVGDDTHEVFMPEEHIPAVDVFWGQQLPWVPWSQRTTRDEPPRQLPGQPELGEHLIRSLIDQGFDVSHTAEVPAGRSVGHAFDFVYGRIMRDQVPPHVPIWLNTYYFPNVPTMKRCYALGKALRRAIESWECEARVAVIGTGGLSHLVIDEGLDRQVLAALQEKDEQGIGSLPEDPFVFGTSEVRNWLVAAGAAHDSDAAMNLVCYEPCYRSPAGTGCACAFAYWK